MQWGEVLSAVLAGGLAGQLTAAFLGYRYAARREFDNWIRDERYRAFSDLLVCVAPFATRDEFDTWPDEIRTLSQRVYLLYPGGRPPEDICRCIESLFNLALDRKRGRVPDVAEWKTAMRRENRALREGLAQAIHRSRHSRG